MSVADMIVLGRIVGPYGLRGWVKFHPFGDDVADLGEMRQWWLGADAEGGQWNAYTLQELKPHAKGWIARFKEVEGRTAAEAIDGQYVGAPRGELPKPAANEYYWADLIGMTVVNTQGERLGKVTELLTCGAHDVLCVQEDVAGMPAGKAKQHLLPFVAQVVKSVDPASATVCVEWGSDW